MKARTTRAGAFYCRVEVGSSGGRAVYSMCDQIEGKPQSHVHRMMDGRRPSHGYIRWWSGEMPSVKLS